MLDKQDNTSTYWAQGNILLGKEHPCKAVPEEGVPVGLGDQQHHQGDDPLYHEVKVDQSGTDKVQQLPNVTTFIPGSSTGDIRQAAGDFKTCTNPIKGPLSTKNHADPLKGVKYPFRSTKPNAY